MRTPPHSPPHALVTVPRRAAPLLPERLAGDLARLAELWTRCVEPVPPRGGSGDFEDWVEAAYRVLGVVEAVGPERTWVHSRPGSAVSALDGRSVSLGELPAGVVQVGMRPGRHGDEGSVSGRLAAGYMSLETFARHAGRRCELAGILTRDEHDVEAVIERMRSEGLQRLVVKGRAAKSLLVTLETGSLEEALSEVDPWALVHREGERDALLVQEWVPMRFEYRLFVVAHQLVTGAGAVVEHTPLDSTGEAFSSLVREHRSDDGTGAPAVADPRVRDLLVEFGWSVVEELSREVPLLEDYVLDVALGPEGAPLVVELNPVPNAGLYASDPRRLFKALLAPARAAS